MFQPSSFKNFKEKSNKVENNAVSLKAKELHLNELTIEIVEYWNTKKIKTHRMNTSKILSRLDKIVRNGLKTAPSIFKIEVIKDVIDKYDKHLKTGFSKLSVGEGKIFKFSVDEFFKFSAYQKERINNNSRLEILKDKRSLFYCFYTNENEFLYPQKEVRNEFKEMYSSILLHFKNHGIAENEIDEDLVRYSRLSLQKCFDTNKGKLIFYDGIISDYEVKNNELFYTPELFFMWLLRFIENKNKNFKITYLNSKIFYSNFVKWIYAIGRGV